MKITLTQNQIDYLWKRKIFVKDQSSSVTYLKPGDPFVFPDNLRAEPYCRLRIGRSLPTIGSFSYSRSILNPLQYTMGRYCSIATNVRFFDEDHPLERFTSSTATWRNRLEYTEAIKDRESKWRFTPFHSRGKIITLQNDVWIGSHVALKPGITLHSGSCVATGAIVTKDVPPYAVVGGNPARILKYRFDENTIADLLELQWWQYSFTDFEIKGDIPIREFIEYIKQSVADGTLTPFNPTPMTAKDLLDNA
jgi:acetyltransferase-like isoleucine patch superfamily enzyme